MNRRRSDRSDPALGRGRYRALARATGYSHVHVLGVLGKGSRCSLDCAAAIASAAGVTLDYLWHHVRRARRARLSR